jgi:hypothetical protein
MKLLDFLVKDVWQSKDVEGKINQICHKFYHEKAYDCVNLYRHILFRGY